MNLTAFRRGLRRFWRQAAAIGLLLGVLTAALSMISSKATYTAENSVLFQVNGLDKIADPSNASNYASSLVTSYATMATSQVVLTPAGQKLNPTQTATDLAPKVKVSGPRSNMVLTITSTQPKRSDAVAIVTTVGNQLKATVDKDTSKVDGQPAVQVADQTVNVEKIAASGLVPNLIKAILVGVLAFLAWLLARAILDSRVREASDVAEVTDAPVVASLPGNADAAAWTPLARGLAYLHPAGQSPSVLVAPVSDAGTAVAAEGAVAMARQLAADGRRVLFVDADLRHHAASDALGATGPGLSEYLSGQADLAQVARTTEGGATVLGAGGTAPNPGELLASSRMRELLGSANGYDQVVVSAPGVLGSSDAAIVATEVAGTLVVVPGGKVKRQQLDEALALLDSAHATVDGVVLTNANR